MRKVNNTDTIIDKMLSGNNEIIFNLISLIRSDENADIFTDDKSYLTAQSNPKAPLWIYLNEKVDITAQEELCDILLHVIEKNKDVHIIAPANLIQGVFAKVSDNKAFHFSEYMPMNAYVCREVKVVEGKGELVMPKAEDKERMAFLIKQMAKDVENYDMTDGEAEKVVEAFIDSQDTFLWKDTDIVALARIAHRNDKYARINTVITDRAYRGNGYAKMLVGKISEVVLAEGLTPMLYADARNPYSNAVYQKIGYEKVGVVTEYMVAYKK